ncbi:hypothetical protein BDN70DRAFT_886136 [Pholiota conissans]|uniref:Nephrocystin 3-like N-terminal domain-containing protein n=1 Tax=Pholiota conissans TaxID=109636 RepID=A0A9P6CNR2_9AGAR|nr:hypothetical protein BDN70DRAFT_886136 [Pholiota conissans]
MPTCNDAHYFSHTSNSIINNPKITHVNGVAQFNKSERHGLKLLLDNITSGAFHDAAERCHPPRCHPHTRTAIRAEIMEWIRAPESKRKLILWMYGPAGSGKTAIAQSIAEECKSLGLLSASFFFSRTAAGRNYSGRLIATIAYQISRFLPEIEDRLFMAIEHDPAVFSRTLLTQIQTLLVEPLQFLPPTPNPIFVILDGVDECGPDGCAQSDMLNALGLVLPTLQHIPLLFLVASRPEYEIREVFEGPNLKSQVKRLALDNSYKPDDDIKLYLTSKFRDVYDKHHRIGSHLPSSWPAEKDIDRLLSKASGQFIFASTVVKFIDSPRHDPAERLDIILGLSAPGNETPFMQLDTLYHFIFSTVVCLPKVLEILTLLFLDGKSSINLSIKIIETLLGYDIYRALVDMHALISVPGPYDNISEPRLHHASLYDFLTDESRSRELYIDATKGHITLSRLWLKQIAMYPPSAHQPSLEDSLDKFNYHSEKSSPSEEILNDLDDFDLRGVLNKSSLETIYSAKWDRFFGSVQHQAGESSRIYLRLHGEFDAFFTERISRYPSTLRTYIPSILAFSSHLSEIFHILLHTIHDSEAEIEEIRQLDSALLDVEHHPGQTNQAFPTMFHDRSRFGNFYVNGENYVALVKQIVVIVFPKPGDSSSRLHVALNGLWNFGWFQRMLSYCSPDLGLAAFLSERTLQYNEHTDLCTFRARQNIARASLEYIERYGFPYFKHTHLPGINRCIVCEERNGAPRFHRPRTANLNLCL